MWRIACGTPSSGTSAPSTNAVRGGSALSRRSSQARLASRKARARGSELRGGSTRSTASPCGSMRSAMRRARGCVLTRTGTLPSISDKDGSSGMRSNDGAVTPRSLLQCRFGARLLRRGLLLRQQLRLARDAPAIAAEAAIRAQRRDGREWRAPPDCGRRHDPPRAPHWACRCARRSRDRSRSRRRECAAARATPATGRRSPAGRAANRAREASPSRCATIALTQRPSSLSSRRIEAAENSLASAAARRASSSPSITAQSPRSVAATSSRPKGEALMA